MNTHLITPTLRSLANPSHQRWLVSRSLRFSTPPTYLHNLALQTRSFSSSRSRAAEPYNPVKEAEARLKKQGKQQTMAGLSPEMQGLPLQDAYVLPPLYEVGISSVGGVVPSFKYIGKRLFRWFNTMRSVMTLGKAQALPKIPNRQWFQGFTMTASTRPLVDELKDIYVKYNEAQAHADISTLRTICQGQALKDAQARLSSVPSGTSMKWEVQKWHGYLFHGHDQKMVNVRVIEADLKSEKQLGQIIVRFDSDQTLTILQRNKSPVTRTSRVREYWAFERMISDRHSRWKIRERIIPYSGGRMPLGMA